jgi:hypothetical protein
MSSPLVSGCSWSCRKIGVAWWPSGGQHRPVVLSPPGDPFGDGVHQHVRPRRHVLITRCDLAPHQPGRIRGGLLDADRSPLVSMECLIGAAYTRRAQAAGLTGAANPSMGRVEAQFADPRIGVLSRWAQLWIDRNFALDYTLKSLEKITDGQPYEVARGLRRVLKHAAYRLLGAMIDILDLTDAAADDPAELETNCAALADALIGELRRQMVPALGVMEANMPAQHRDVIRAEYDRWAATDGWRLINAADPCGT